MPVTSLVTASFVTRELGYRRISNWAEGDSATQSTFAPIETYEERFNQLLDEISDLGFQAIDLWGAHLHYDWATEEHFDVARTALAAHDMTVNALAAWCSSREALVGFCRVANEVGTSLIGGGSSLLTDDRAYALAVLADHGVRFAIENHAETSTQQVTAVIGVSEWLGSCADTGWWAIQGVHPPTAIRELGENVLTVHLKDIDPSTHKGARPGTGSADIAGCLDALADIDFDGGVAIEHEPDGWDPSDDLRAGYGLVSRWVGQLQ